VQVYAAYPMTPSTGIMNYLAGKAKDYGVVVEQAEMRLLQSIWRSVHPLQVSGQ